MSFIKKIFTKKNIIQIFLFCVVGLINAVVLMGVHNLLLLAHLNYIVAYGIAFICSVIVAYFLNKIFVFKNQGKKNISSFVKVFAVYLATFLLGLLLVYIFVDIAGVMEELAPLFNILICTPINYLLIKFWALKTKHVNITNNDSKESDFTQKGKEDGEE